MDFSRGCLVLFVAILEEFNVGNHVAGVVALDWLVVAVFALEVDRLVGRAFPG